MYPAMASPRATRKADSYALDAVGIIQVQFGDCLAQRLDLTAEATGLVELAGELPAGRHIEHETKC